MKLPTRRRQDSHSQKDFRASHQYRNHDEDDDDPCYPFIHHHRQPVFVSRLYPCIIRFITQVYELVDFYGTIGMKRSGDEIELEWGMGICKGMGMKMGRGKRDLNSLDIF